jgi:wobble nucleotide-excising tRNase
MSLKAIAKQLIEMDESIVLIYAFNGTGKTQLSIAYKDETKAANGGKHTGVYYNAFSEDLFVWDNDDENNGTDVKLNILPSSLNKFHSFLFEDEQAIMSKLAAYNPKYRFHLNVHENLEKGIESVTFFIEGNEDVPIKISRGEERIFVWCFYLALLDVDGWSNEQDAHIFIDDPVSSLDEHNIFITANTLFQQIETHYEKKRIIITTHHIGLLSILANRLTKGEGSGRYKNLTGIRILKIVNDNVVLEELKNNVFLYHLHLLQVLDEAKKSQLYTYHFALLRQLLENISSFQGSGSPGRLLSKMGVEKDGGIMEWINTHSHKTPYYYQTEMMSDADRDLFVEIFDALTKNYHFKF